MVRIQMIDKRAKDRDLRSRMIGNEPLVYMGIYKVYSYQAKQLIKFPDTWKMADEVSDAEDAEDAEDDTLQQPWDFLRAVNQIDDELAIALYNLGYHSFKDILSAVDKDGISVLTSIPGIGDKRAAILYEHSREGVE